MCGPQVPWDWFVLDLSYVLVLVGGSLVFRAKGTSLVTWMWFGMLATFVGTILFYYTYDAQMAYNALMAEQDALGVMSSCGGTTPITSARQGPAGALP